MKFKLENIFPYFVFLVISIALQYVFFHDLKEGEFIFSGDQLLWFSFDEAFDKSFFVRKMDHLGILNSWQMTVQFWDTLYYLILYKAGFSLISTERISFFLTLFLSFCGAFTGFRLLGGLFNKEKPKTFLTVAITIWYCLNPYTLILWHGGIYNLGLAFTYSLAPLILYLFHRSVFMDSSMKTKIECALLLFLASFVFWLFAVIVFFLLIYTFLYLLISKISFTVFIRRISTLSLLYLPLVSVVLFLMLYEYTHNAGDFNSEYLPTFGNQLGGLWYQFLMLFSWGIYTVWTPRTLFPFGEYFFSPQYIGSTLALYGLILVGGFLMWRDLWWNRRGVDSKEKPNLLFNQQNTFPFVILILLGVSIFFAKGTQAPFGGIFLYLFEHLPGFSVFRSADHRFGFAVVFSVALLLMYVSNWFNKLFFSGFLLLVVLIQSHPLLSGSAVRGEEISGKYFDRIIHVSNDYKLVADFLNSRDDGTGYVLMLPSVQYGRYIVDSVTGEEYVGQDLFPKVVHKPFVYISTETGMSRQTENALEKAVVGGSYEDLKKFPIRYILTRSDITCSNCSNILEEMARRKSTPLFQTGPFSVYELSDSQPIVSVSNSLFQMINPVKFRVNLEHVSGKVPLELGSSFNDGWKIYLDDKKVSAECDGGYVRQFSNTKECVNSQSFFEGDELKYFLSPSLFEESHDVGHGYANRWIIDVDSIKEHGDSSMYSMNDDGTINMTLVVYYKPQSWLYFYALVSIATCISLLFALKKP